MLGTGLADLGPDGGTTQSKHGVRFIVRASHVEGSTAEGGIARETLRNLLSWVQLIILL